MENQVIESSPANAVAEMQPFYAQLAELEANNTKLVFDYASKTGDKAARSHVHSLRLTKGTLERVRVAAKADYLAKGRAVDAEAEAIKGRIDSMINVHQSELDRIAKIETDRVAALETRLSLINLVGSDCETASQIKLAITGAEMIKIGDDWQEFIADAAKAKDAKLEQLRDKLAAREKLDAEQAELAKLRQEAEDRAKKDREDAIAKAAVEKAQADAARQAAEAEAKQKQLLADAEKKAKEFREAAERREIELKLAAEQAERRRIEDAKQAEEDRTRAAIQAEEAKEKAVAAEKARVAAIEKAEADALAKREADRAHKGKINRAAVAAMMTQGMTEDVAKKCVTMIASGLVPSISIQY
jgi:colicin import membrane protein